MQSDRLFYINRLKRTFEGRTVLDIEDLTIPSGKLVCLLGSSGSGKTTMLEALGLMSTPTPGELGQCPMEVEFFPHDVDAGNAFIYSKLWPSAANAGVVRNRYFSFLFQQDNLLPQLSLEQNILLSSLIQGVEVDASNYRQELANLVNRVNLSADKLDDLPNQSSIGQRQRLAFVRAQMREFQVLFADEPTGNLDQNNARELFTLIRSSLGTNNSAIIVTHDIKLAEEFSDIIIVICRNGVITQDCVFERTASGAAGKWQGGNEVYDSVSVIDKVFSLMNIENSRLDLNGGHPTSDTVSIDPLEVVESHPPVGSGLSSVFDQIVKKDLSVGSRPALLLTTIFFLLISAIGISDGSLEYLSKKMNDPFVSSLDIEIPADERHLYYDIQTVLTGDSLAEALTVNEVNGFKEDFMVFRNKNTKEIKSTTSMHGRTIEFDDPIMERLGDPGLVLLGSIFDSPKNRGLIVTRKVLLDYGYPEDALFLEINLLTSELGDIYMPLPIRAIVEHLPGDNDFLVTSYFQQQRDYGATPFHPAYSAEKNEIRIFLPTEDEDLLFSFLDKVDTLNIHNNWQAHIGLPQKYYQTHRRGSFIRIEFDGDSLGVGGLDSLYASLQSTDVLQEFEFYRLYDYPFDDTLSDLVYDRLSVNIGNLGKVSDLRELLLSKFKLKIDLEKVESRENYLFVAKLNHILSAIIIVFSITIVAIFVYYILFVHLYKMRVYLGTMKAFGLSSADLGKLYVSKTLKFLGSSVLLGSLLALVIGQTGILKQILQIFTVLEDGHSYFNLFNIWAVILVLLTVVSGYITVRMIIRKTLEHSPGDLIYDRTENHLYARSRSSVLSSKEQVTETAGV